MVFKYLLVLDDKSIVEITRARAIVYAETWAVEIMEQLADRHGMFQKNNVIVIKIFE